MKKIRLVKQFHAIIWKQVFVSSLFNELDNIYIRSNKILRRDLNEKFRATD